METIPFRKKLFDHIKRHKGKYIAGGVCMMVGSVVGICLSINKKMDVVSKSIKTANALRIINATNSMLAPAMDIDVGSLDIANHIGRNGHPGNVIYCNETKQIFKSHREATRELGIDSRDLWAYLKGIKPHARGYTFKRIGEARDTKPA